MAALRLLKAASAPAAVLRNTSTTATSCARSAKTCVSGLMMTARRPFYSSASSYLCSSPSSLLINISSSSSCSDSFHSSSLLHSQTKKQLPLLHSARSFGSSVTVAVAASITNTTTYTNTAVGQPETLEYRLFFQDKSGKTVSPWHDIPLYIGDGLVNMVVEIPRETRAKMEVATDEPNTPIKQDTKKGKLRFYPYNIDWNYGLLPQTWEDPNHTNADVENAAGDNDPVDAVEIGSRTGKVGEVYAVKPLGVLAMIDEGELDWKVIVIRADDPKAPLLNDTSDVDIHFPGTLTAIRDWFRDYKIPDGKPANRFGLGDKAANKEYALKVIAETNSFWADLVKRSVPAGELSLV